MESRLCLISSNIQSEVGKQGSAIGFVHKQFVLLKICRKYEQTSCLQLLLENTVGHINCLLEEKYEKTGDKFFMAKTRSNTGENGSRITWNFM